MNFKDFENFIITGDVHVAYHKKIMGEEVTAAIKEILKENEELKRKFCKMEAEKREAMIALSKVKQQRDALAKQLSELHSNAIINMLKF